MRQPNRLVKAAGLASSILLVGAFVAYRANAFNQRGEADPPADNAGTNESAFAGTWSGSGDSRPLVDFELNSFNPPRTALEEAAAQRPPINGFINGIAGEPEGTYISSPKSGPIFVPQEPSASGSVSTIMYGSKSGVVLPPPAPVQAASGGSVMSGSKSDRVFVPQKSANGDERRTTIIQSSKGGVVFRSAANSPAAPSKTGADTTIMSSSKSFILATPPAQAAANGPARGVSQSSTRSR